MKKQIILLILALIAILSSVSACSAADIYINSSITTPGDGSSWDHAYKNITDGYTKANDNGDTINLADGQYNGIGNTNITIAKNMTIQGQSQTGTIVNGTGTGWIFTVNEGYKLILQNLTLTNGTAIYGGAIRNYGNLTSQNCTFTSNKANTWGGAILNSGSLTTKYCTFSDNTADFGASIWNSGTLIVTGCSIANNHASSWGAIYDWANSTIENSTFSGNTASYGGAIYHSVGSMNVNGCTFANNNASYGGAILNLGNLTAQNSTFTSNNAIYGGAISNYCDVVTGGSSNVICAVTNCTFTSNTAWNIGGAILNYCHVNDGSCSVNCAVTNCTFTSNKALQGGGISNYCYVEYGSCSVNCAVTNCTFTSNTADISGGAISNYDNAGPGDYGSVDCSVTNCTFTSNSASSGGAISNDRLDSGSSGNVVCTVTNCTFTSNTASSGGAISNNCLVYGGSASVICNVIGCTFTGNTASSGGAVFNHCLIYIVGSGMSSLKMNFNRFYGNTAPTGSAIYNDGGSVDAENNWWGTNNPDTNWSNLLHGITNNPAKWVELKINATPDEIGIGESSTVTVNLNYNNLGENLLETYGKSIPDVNVVLDATLGTLNQYNGLISAGQNLTVTFTAGDMPGTAVVNAIVDTGTQGKSIRILRDDAYVATAADGGSDSNNGSSTRPFLTLNKAITELRAGGRIHIANGIYNGLLNKGLFIDKNMTIMRDTWIPGTGNNVTIDAENLGRIFINDVHLILHNLTLTNGKDYGAILNRGYLTAEDCTFTNNRADLGGAIYNYGGSLNVTNCTFTGNTADYVGGGAIYNHEYSTCTVTDCTFISNGVTTEYGHNWGGGAIYNAGIMNVTGSNFTNNYAVTNGGAIFNCGSSVITNCTFTGNTAFPTTSPGTNFINDIDMFVLDYGRGDICNVNSPLTVTGCTFNGHTAGYSGNGGILNAQGNCVFHFNRLLGNIEIANFISGGTINANLNWWGTNSGRPGMATTWVILTVNATPSIINNTQTSTITADFNHINGGGDLVGGHIPDGPITLSIPWGSLNTPETHSIITDTVAGVINPAIFSANEGPAPSSVRVDATADGYTTTDLEAAYIYINNVANLTVTKTGPTTVIAGNPITYTITVTNNGPGETNNVQIQDIFSPSLSGISWTAVYSNGTTIYGTGDLNLNSIIFPAGDSCTITVNGVVLSSTPAGTLSNTANVTSTTTDLTTTDNSATVFTTVNTQANLSVTKTGPSTVFAGNQIAYTITVTNNGPSDAQNVQIQDTIPAILQNVTHDSFNLGTIGAGQSKTVTITGTVPANTAPGTVIENSATVTSDTSGAINPSNTVQTTVDAHSTLTVENATNFAGQTVNLIAHVKDYNGNLVNGGQVTFTVGSTTLNPVNVVNGVARIDNWQIPSGWTAGIYTITANFDGTGTNYANSTGTGNLKVDPTPTNITIGNVTGVNSKTVNLNAALIDVYGHLLTGKTINFKINGNSIGSGTTDSNGIATLNYKLNSAGNFTIIAEFAGDSEYVNSTGNGTLTVDPSSDLYIIITSNKNNPSVGEIFIVTYKLGNKGPDAASNVTMTITLPEGFEISQITGDGNWTYNAATRTITWTLGNVPVGDPYLYISGKVLKPGTYVFSSISSETYNINTEGVTPITIKAVNEVKAASKTIPMQHTGLPIAGLILAIFSVFGGLLTPKRK